MGTTTATTYTASNLAADTSYTFAVAALDAAGSSAATSPISVHTAALIASPNNSTTWAASSIYTAGMTATENGVTYKANWWTQNPNPPHNNAATPTAHPRTLLPPTTAAAHQPRESPP